jgi:hypothetical protein
MLASAGVATLAGLLVIRIVHTPAVHAQSEPGAESRVEFEVASVKLVNHPVPMHPYRLDISHLTVTIGAVPLRFIIGLPYQYQTGTREGRTGLAQ